MTAETPSYSALRKAAVLTARPLAFSNPVSHWVLDAGLFLLIHWNHVFRFPYGE